MASLAVRIGEHENVPWRLAYADLMSAAGYDATPVNDGDNIPRAEAVKRYRNAHVVQLIEQLQHDVAEVRTALEAQARGANH